MKCNLNPVIEKYLKNVILPDLDKGRPGWDRLHTVAVVHYVRQIIESLQKFEIDPVVLIISAYLHDWGYTSLFKQGKPVSYDRVQKAKKLHVVLGKEKAARLLKKAVFSKLTKTQKKRIVHLVRIHDELYRLKAQDELILMEADTLGALDSNFVKPTYDYESHKKYIRELKKSRLPLFLTSYSKTQVNVLLKKRMRFYQKKKPTASVVHLEGHDEDNDPIAYAVQAAREKVYAATLIDLNLFNECCRDILATEAHLFHRIHLVDFTNSTAPLEDIELDVLQEQRKGLSRVCPISPNPICCGKVRRVTTLD